MLEGVGPRRLGCEKSLWRRDVLTVEAREPHTVQR